MIQMKDKFGLLYNKTKKIISWRTQEELGKDWIHKIKSLLTKTMPFLNHIPVLIFTKEKMLSI